MSSLGSQEHGQHGLERLPGLFDIEEETFINFRILGLFIALVSFVALAAPVPLAAQDNNNLQYATFITFNAPDARTGAGQGTQAYGISSTGEITGWYVDANNVTHGFLVTPW